MTVVRDSEATREARTVWWKEGRVVVIGVIVLLAAIFFFWRGCHKTTAAEGEATDIVVSVQVAKAERGTISNDITAVATLTARNQADIMPKISAQIVSMPLLLNRTVKAGEALVGLESRDLSAQHAEAGAAVQEADTTVHTTANGSVPLTNAQDRKSVRDAQATVENTTKTYERRKVLFAEGGISKKDLEASQLAVTVAEGDLKLAESQAALHRGVLNPGDIRISEAKARQARERLANVTAQLGYTTIRAPFDGVVTEQFQHQGDFANPGTKMLTIADASTLIAKMEVSEATATTLRSGDPVKVAPDDLPNQSFSGTVSLVGRGADVQSRSVEVWVMVPNPGGRLRPNGVARVTISSQTRTGAIVIPSSAVTLDATNGNAGTVMVVDDKSVAHEIKVTTGIRSGGRTEVLSGLEGGETVVTEGNYGLPDGIKVALPGAPVDEKKQAPTRTMRKPADDEGRLETTRPAFLVAAGESAAEPVEGQAPSPVRAWYTDMPDRRGRLSLHPSQIHDGRRTLPRNLPVFRGPSSLTSLPDLRRAGVPPAPTGRLARSARSREIVVAGRDARRLRAGRPLSARNPVSAPSLINRCARAGPRLTSIRRRPPCSLSPRSSVLSRASLSPATGMIA